MRWIVIEFDPQCATAQAEDSLQLYIPGWRPKIDSSMDSEGAHSALETPQELGNTHWPVLHKFHGAYNWPKQAILLPGGVNTIVLSCHVVCKERQKLAVDFTKVNVQKTRLFF